MSNSQNGYPCIFTDNSPELHEWIIPGAKRTIRLRAGKAGFLLACYALWHHKNIESLDNPTYDDWGWAQPRVIPGTNSYSNHASGTAIDINATLHPWGEVNTYSPLKRWRIRHRLSQYRSLIRWGGDYRRKKDEMHFEIVASESQIGLFIHDVRHNGWWKRKTEYVEIINANPSQFESVIK